MIKIFKTIIVCSLLIVKLVNSSIDRDLLYNVYDEPLKNCLLRTDPYVRMMLGNRKCD